MHICTGPDLVNMVYKCQATIYYSLVNFCNYILIKNSNHIIFCNFIKCKIRTLRRNIHKEDQIMITILITLEVLVKEDFA
jgi:hypothetical protein